MNPRIIETVTGDIFEFSTLHCDGCALWAKSGYSRLWADWHNFFHNIKERMYTYVEIDGKWMEPPLIEDMKKDMYKQIPPENPWQDKFCGKLFRIIPPEKKLDILYIHPNPQDECVHDIKNIPNMVTNALDDLRWAKAKSIAFNGIQIAVNQVPTEEISRIMIDAAKNWLESNNGIDKIYFVDLRGGFEINQ
jgi:hypothetical protein